MPSIQNRDITYRHGDITMKGYFACPADKPDSLPGILIVHDAFGLDHNYMRVADRLAGHGYAAFALDLWGDRRTFASPEAVMPTLTELVRSSAEWMGRVLVARQTLSAQPGVDGNRIAAIGYCLGGATVLEYARLGYDIKGVVSFHGGLDFVGTEWDSRKTRARLLICTGIDDPLVPWDSLTRLQDNLRKSGVNWELDIYSNTKHSFTRPDAARQSTPDRSVFNPEADRSSWRAMLRLFEDIFEDWL